ncbi:FtsK/SpoIIIE domain-containing protein [Paenibacillus sp. P96]|uniref:FtsK/SpoIIIE domain-containing protein n=1 Tax=Paenibacillus zeirhizosphaerae TaxID=2987519 RepID=A0ABT9FNJ7_9BACL|nr:FtsK/SpoIIIE domain-containing protein [Paenibacillus sp. P96]MDP4096285.1 FtsK/SpoIIIE domain-containing protein [Paenibacillus sp. P96]
MYSSARKLLGQWMVELVIRYFQDQQRANGDKLFTKITGIDDAAWGDVLQSFRDAEDRLLAYYKPVIRTLNKVNGFESYQCQQHETSTWLRNNTAAGSALLIFMNDVSPEAQSLENIFTIDEARLLSPQGLEVLYQLFADIHKCYGDELEALKQFLSMYGRIADAQLRTVLAFLAAVVQDPQLSMIDRIQQNMDQLLLFRDSKLSFRGADGYARLKRNYQLSRLEREGKTVKKDDLIDNLYSFIEKSTAPQDEHELWDKVHPDVFRQQALAFIHNQSSELLQYDFDVISTALFFKLKAQKINEKINDFRMVLEGQDDWKPEKDQIVTEALEAIDDGREPDKIQEFINEFTDELQEYPKLKKDLERILSRQRQLAEYTELSDALLQESIQLLEEYSSEQEEYGLNEAAFVLYLNSPVQESARTALSFHLLQLEQLTGYIKFDESSLKDSDAQEKDGDLSFKLQLLIHNKAVLESQFKLVKAFTGALPSMIEHMQDTGHIPYVREYYGSEIKLTDVVQEVKERVSGYVATGYSHVEDAAVQIYAFIAWYTRELKGGLNSGLSSIDFAELEAKLELLLSQIHQSALLSKHVFQYIGHLGAIDRYDCKISDSVGHAQTRVLTLLNPLRLLSYAKRLSRIRGELDSWVEQQRITSSTIDEMKAYLQQKQEETAHLSPRYFVIEDQFLIEQQERMGEGIFALNGKNSGEEQLVDTFSEEFLTTVKTYLDVYPYASDCLDIVFLYCPHAEYVTSAVDRIFRYTDVRKVKAIVHCETNGAAVHEHLNGWMNQEEQHSERYNSFPRVEIQVIAEHSINAMMQSVSQYLLDADIGVLINYFGQTSHIQYRLEKVSVKDSDNWFGTIYKEPLKRDDAVKRVSFISESLPKVMQYFYQMQFIVHNNETVRPDEHYLLRNVISITKLSDTELINYMHDQFNWSLFIDRHLDKSLLRQVSSKAQIIKYKSKAGNDKDFRTILSSSKYIRKLANELADHEYYDRLHQKYTLMLKNDHIDPQIIVQATERVKDISGGVVLRAIGPGKFAHEMMAIYLATQVRAAQDGELTVWSVCDELPWFQGNSRRPDLVRMALRRTGERIHIHFEIIELKFISHTIFEPERYDAIKQVKAGLEVYQNRFVFNEHPASASLWRQELIYYLLEYGTYSVEDALLLKELQSIPTDCIDVELSGSIDTFVYTSNMLELSVMEGHVNGYQMERLHNEYTNHIYNRSYILRALGASQEDVTPSYEALEELPVFVTSKLEFEDAALENVMEEMNVAVISRNDARVEVETPVPDHSEAAAAHREIEETLAQVAGTTAAYGNVDKAYPEQIALADEAREQSNSTEDMLPLVESYQKKLRFNFSQIGIPIKVVDAFIGVSVIRLVVEIPVDKSYSSIENKAKDICLWLQLPSVPFIALRKGRINIDINREEPETVYFEDFMEITRAQYPLEKLKGKLIAPIGVGQVRELIVLDFSSSNTPHLLVGGTTGSGKSVTINSIILAMMCLYEPSEVQFLFIDPKKVEFMIYENRTHTKQVITEIEEAIIVLEQLVEEMEQRYSLFAREGVMSIDEFVEATGSPLPRLVVVFDEFADFMEREKSLSDRVESSILRLGAKARAAGIHLLICTQNPKADIVPTNIRNNLPARLALKAADHHASKIIINEEGAETLGGKGDFLIKLDLPETVRAKSPFLIPRVKRALIQYFTKQE